MENTVLTDVSLCIITEGSTVPFKQPSWLFLLNSDFWVYEVHLMQLDFPVGAPLLYEAL